MFFDDWREKSADAHLSKRLLWEYDMTDFDWDYMRTVVVSRVIERGWPEDYYAAIRIYGGLEHFRNIIKEIPVMSDRDCAFVCAVFDLKKEELKCYTRKQSREERLK